MSPWLAFVAGVGLTCIVFGFVAVWRAQKDIDDGI